MSKYKPIDIWNERYGNEEERPDYCGRSMKKSACGNPNSAFEPTIDHIRPLSEGGKDVKENIELCNYRTNEEKGDNFPHWVANGNRYKAVKTKYVANGYTIVSDD